MKKDVAYNGRLPESKVVIRSAFEGTLFKVYDKVHGIELEQEYVEYLFDNLTIVLGHFPRVLTGDDTNSVKSQQ